MSQTSYVLVPVHVFEARMNRLELLVGQLISKEERMSAEQSAEARALDEAITGLQGELADVSTVDAEIVVDLEGVGAAIGKVNPVTPEQVNAVTAATSSLQALTAKLKAAGEGAAAAEGGAPAPAPAPAPEVPPAPAPEAEQAPPAAPEPEAAPAPEGSAQPQG